MAPQVRLNNKSAFASKAAKWGSKKKKWGAYYGSSSDYSEDNSLFSFKFFVYLVIACMLVLSSSTICSPKGDGVLARMRRRVCCCGSGSPRSVDGAGDEINDGSTNDNIEGVKSSGASSGLGFNKPSN